MGGLISRAPHRHIHKKGLQRTRLGGGYRWAFQLAPPPGGSLSLAAASSSGWEEASRESPRQV